MAAVQMDFGFVRCVRSECETKWRRPQKPCLWSVVILIYFWLFECYCCYLKHGNGITLFFEGVSSFCVQTFSRIHLTQRIRTLKEQQEQNISLGWMGSFSFICLSPLAWHLCTYQVMTLFAQNIWRYMRAFIA